MNKSHITKEIEQAIEQSIESKNHSAVAFYFAVKYNKFLNTMPREELLELMRKTSSWRSEFAKANSYVKVLKRKGEYTGVVHYEE